MDAYNASQELYTVEWIDMTNDSGAMTRADPHYSMQAGSSDYDVLSMDVVWAGEFAAAGYIETDRSDDAGGRAEDFAVQRRLHDRRQLQRQAVHTAVLP